MTHLQRKATVTTDWDIPIAPDLLTPEEAKALGERVLAGDLAAVTP